MQINAGLAQGKNRSGFGWFLASLLLGPIAKTPGLAIIEPPSVRQEVTHWVTQDA
ncbi:MAG TPA: hypothetical protein VG838_12280 [Opitutaceae bacterium]|nr:hypothetical protein [Opitutaceae bacterium]